MPEVNAPEVKVTETCLEEIKQVLSKYNCTLEPRLILSNNGVIGSEIKVILLETPVTSNAT